MTTPTLADPGPAVITEPAPETVARPRLHIPDRFRDLTRPGATFKATPPGARPKAERWRIVDHDDGAPAEMWLYDEIGFWGVTAAEFCQALAGLDASEIVLRVNSPGGDVFDGVAMYNALVDHPATVTAKVDGLAASAASFIIQAADKVIMGRQAELMIHDASGLCIGNASDMTEMAAVLDRVSDGIASIYHDRAGGSQKSWRDVMRGEQWYTPDEAVAAGLADEVMAAPKKRAAEPAAARADERPAAEWDLSVFRYAGREAAPAPAAAGRERIVASAAPKFVSEAGPELVDVPARTVVEAHVPAEEPAAATDPPAVQAVDDPEPVAVDDAPADSGETQPVEDAPVVAEEGAALAAVQDPQAPEPDPAPTPEPVPEPEPVLVSAAAFPGSHPAAPQPDPEPAPDPWAALTEHLTVSRPATVDDLLAALREDTTP